MANKKSNSEEKEFLKYFVNVFKKNKLKDKNISIKAMHNINRISIIMFILAVVILLIRRLF